MKLSFVGGKFMVRELGSLPRSRIFRTIPHPPRLASLAAPRRPGANHSGTNSPLPYN